MYTLPVIVRRAVPNDHRDLMALYTDFIEEDKFSNLDNDSFLEVIASANNYVLVAEEDSRLVGMITASRRLVVRRLRPILQVDEFYVDPGFRKHGVGKKLIEAVEKIAGDNDIQRIYIESGYKHTLGHKFYEKNGYENSGYYFLKVL